MYTYKIETIFSLNSNYPYFYFYFQGTTMKAKDAAKIDGIDQWAFLSAANGASASARTEFECGLDYLLSDDDHVKISCFYVYVYVYF